MVLSLNRTLKSIKRKSYLTENRTDKIFMLVFLIIFGLCFVPFVLKSRQNQKNDIPVSVSNKVYPENNNILYTVEETPLLKFKRDNNSVLKPENLKSDAALLYNVDTDTVLFSKNSDKICFPASITKIMTAYIAVKYIPLETQFTVGTELSLLQPDSSVADLCQGNVITLEDLLYALLLPSGNDAAYTIAVNVARHVSGNADLNDTQAVEFFCSLMNEEAEKSGTKNTNFCDPDGYDNTFHYTTAEDMLRIALHTDDFPVLAQIAAVPYRKTTIVSGQAFYWSNGNCLVVNDNQYFLPFATGFKTGFTDEAGYCMVATATNNNQRFIAVTLNSPSLAGRYTDAANLFYSVIAPDKIIIDTPQVPPSS